MENYKLKTSKYLWRAPDAYKHGLYAEQYSRYHGYIPQVCGVHDHGKYRDFKQ